MEQIMESILSAFRDNRASLLRGIDTARKSTSDKKISIPFIVYVGIAPLVVTATYDPVLSEFKELSAYIEHDGGGYTDMTISALDISLNCGASPKWDFHDTSTPIRKE